MTNLQASAEIHHSRDNDRRSDFEIFNDSDAAPAPDLEVHQIEDSIACNIALATTKDLFPLRPGYGTVGQSNILQTNLADIRLPQQDLFCYDIRVESSLSGAEPRPAIIRRLISMLLKLYFAQERTLMVTDFQSTLLSCVEIPSAKAYRLRASLEARRTGTHSRPVYKIYFLLRSKSSAQGISEHLNPAEYERVPMTRPELCCSLQTILNFYASQRAFEMNVAVGSPHSRSNFNGRRLGSSSISVRIYNATARTLLIVTSKQNQGDRSVLFSAVIGKYLATFPNRLDQLEKLLKNVRVLIRTTSSRQHHTTVRVIQGLAACTDGAHLRYPPKVSCFGAGPEDVEVFQESSHASLSQSRSGHGYISLKTYFEQKCGVTLDPDLPVINVGTFDHPLYCPVELCEAQPKQLLDWLSARLHKCQRRPFQTSTTESDKNSSMAQWCENWNARFARMKIQIFPNPISIYSRVLPAPRVTYARRSTVRITHGAWRLCDHRVMKAAKFRHWSWLYLDLPSKRVPELESSTIRQHLARLNERLQRMGIFASTVAIGQRIHMNELTAQAQIQEAVGLLHAKKRPSMILIIFSPRAERFIHLARWACDIIHGVPSIEVKDDWLTRNDQELYGKIGLRINLKLGGQNHLVDPADLGFFANRSTMIVGVAEESVPATKVGTSAFSVTGVVASSGSHLSQWPADINIQKKNSRVPYHLNTLIESRLHSWREEHGNRMPKDIVIFRSNLPDGDKGLWVEQEVALLRDTCKKMALVGGRHSPLPRIAIVLVDERHDARFFPTAETESSKFGHPLAGTVVDRGITQPGCWDFLLQPLGLMPVGNGPVRYLVVLDEVFRRRSSSPNTRPGPSDLLQDLTHKLCYLPGESTRARDVCSPIHYARQACARARSYCHVVDCSSLTPESHLRQSSRVALHQKLRNTMFYI